MNRSLAVGALLLVCGQALGQSVNVDLNATSGDGAGVPASSFGGAAAQPGTWNGITNSSAATVALNGLNGSSAGVNFTWNKTQAISGIFDSGISGDTSKLLYDGQFMSSWGTLTYTFSGLDAGTYAVFAYAGRPNDTIDAGVSVTGSTSSYQYVGGNLSNDLVPGVSHSIHVVTVGANGSIEIKINDTFGGYASCSGIQLKKIDANRLRFHVSKNQTANPENGTSWANAYSDLQPVLQQVANIGGSYCEVWTRQGFYYPTTGTDRSASFVIPSGLHLYGGFAGTETSLDQRTVPWFFITAMSGSIGGASTSDNSYHVVDASGAATGTLIDGFTIANGRANGSGADGKGGGMIAVDSRVDVRNSKFIGNYASIDGGAVLSTGFPSFNNCLFFNNDSSGSSAGIYHHTTGQLSVTNSSFLGNESTGDGAAVKILFADASFFGCLFSGNEAFSGNGGAVSMAGDSTDEAYFTNCTISGNFSGQYGGGVYGGASTELIFRNSILWGNNDGLSSDIRDEQYGNHPTAFATLSSTSVQGVHSDPKFVDADGADNVAGTTDDDCRLQDTSPCIDAGDNALLPWDFGDVDGDGFTFEYYPFDLDGNSRVLDVPWAFGEGAAVVDRGAYEFQYQTCPADFDKSGFVDTEDYDAFVFAFESGDQSADFDGTGFVDTDDFDAFVFAFESGC